MSFGYTTIDGERVEVHVAAAFSRMAADFERDTGCSLHISSGTRTRAEQEYLYNGWIRGLPGFNLAARPGTSNHEEDGPSGPRSLDLYDSGSDAGVTRRGSARDGWMERNAGNYGFENEGYNFNPVEAWHKTFRGSLDGATAGTGSSIPIDQIVLLEQQFLNAARGENLIPDGQYGAATKAAFERYQTFLNNNGFASPLLVVDGEWGNATQAAHAKYYAVWAASQYPKFPLPAGYYFGPADGPTESISGIYSYQGALTPWQQRMKDRGWVITPDGQYGPETAGVAKAFQTEKGLTADGLIGPQTWDAAWTAPVTPPAGSTTPTVPTVPEIPANPQTPDNPRGLPVYTPVYPGAYIGLVAPLGDGPRGFKGEDNVVVPVIIDTFLLHRTGTNGDDGDWFSYKNSRSSCPNVHVLSDGRSREMIRPKFKPALTGPEWNWRSFGIEIQGAGDGNAAQFETVADMLAWLASFDGKTLDGIPVSFKLDRAHFKNHREVLPGTECPGDWWDGKMDALLERAKIILATKYAPVVTPDPEPEPSDTVEVEREWLEGLGKEFEDMAEEIIAILAQSKA